MRTINWSTPLHSVLRNASNKCHSLTVEAKLKFLFVFGVLFCFINESDDNEKGKRNDESGNVCGLL